jgi:hypothetical protein
MCVAVHFLDLYRNHLAKLVAPRRSFPHPCATVAHVAKRIYAHNWWDPLPDFASAISFSSDHVFLQTDMVRFGYNDCHLPQKKYEGLISR